MLQVGEKFPSFALTATVGVERESAFRLVTDQEYPDLWKVYFFWPNDFTFICPTEIEAFALLNSQFEEKAAELLGGSTDSEYVHLAWRKQNSHLKSVCFPMLADVRRELTTALGILDPVEGVAQRATFIVDPDNAIRFVAVYDLKVGRNPHEVLRTLAALQTDHLCPCNWQEGEPTLGTAAVS